MEGTGGMDRLVFDCARMNEQAARLRELCGLIARVSDDVGDVLAALRCDDRAIAAVRAKALECRADVAWTATAVGESGALLEEISAIYDTVERRAVENCLGLPTGIADPAARRENRSAYGGGELHLYEPAGITSSKMVVEPWLMQLLYGSGAAQAAPKDDNRQTNGTD